MTKVYTLEVTATAGTLHLMSHEPVPAWSESMTVHVEAADLEAAREVARDRGTDFARECVEMWQREDGWGEAPESVEDVDVHVAFEDLVVATTAMRGTRE